MILNINQYEFLIFNKKSDIILLEFIVKINFLINLLI